MHSGLLPSVHKHRDKSIYEVHRSKSILFLLLLAVALVAVFLLSLGWGSYDTPLLELVKGVFGLSADKKINIIVQNNRLPRICTAMLAGAGLGLAGCILQAILHNPLASASTLGVSQGASFGAAFAIVVLGLGGTASIGVPLCAFVGSVAVALIILGLSRFRRISPEGIVLSGVAISSMFTGATTLIQYFADEVELANLVYWTFGDLGTTGWTDIVPMAIVVFGLILYTVLHRWDYNAMLSGPETAASLGIRVGRLTIVNMLLCCVVSAVIVSNVGLISFIGLVAPHMVRQVVGKNHTYLIPGSVLMGAVVLLLGDLVARAVLAPVILPIGAITSFLGGPLFLYLLFKGGKKE